MFSQKSLQLEVGSSSIVRNCCKLLMWRTFSNVICLIDIPRHQLPQQLSRGPRATAFKNERFHAVQPVPRCVDEERSSNVCHALLIRDFDPSRIPASRTACIPLYKKISMIVGLQENHYRNYKMHHHNRTPRRWQVTLYTNSNWRKKSKIHNEQY